jgi:hypothetical protein
MSEVESTQSTTTPNQTPETPAAPQGTSTTEPQGVQAERKPQAAAFSALAKKEKMIRAEQQKIAAEREQIQKDMEEVRKFNELKAKARMNPDEYMKAAGLTYEEYVEWKLNGGKPGPDAQNSMVREEIEKLKKELEDKDNKRLEEQRAQLEQQKNEVVANFVKGINDYLDENKETYELIHMMGYQDAVVSTIDTQFQKTGKILSKEEAAKIVEEFLEGEVERLTKESKKVQSRVKPVTPEAQAPNPNPQATSAPKTLTNGMVSSSAPSMLPAKTENDRLKRAMAALDR